MLTFLRVFETILVMALALLLGHVVETRVKARCLTAGLAGFRLGRLGVTVNVYRPGRALLRLALV